MAGAGRAVRSAATPAASRAARQEPKRRRASAAVGWSGYLGRENNLRRVAAAVVAERADAVELCIDQQAGVRPLRDLLAELSAAGRPDARIVLHRVA